MDSTPFKPITGAATTLLLAVTGSGGSGGLTINGGAATIGGVGLAGIIVVEEFS